MIYVIDKLCLECADRYSSSSLALIPVHYFTSVPAVELCKSLNSSLNSSLIKVPADFLVGLREKVGTLWGILDTDPRTRKGCRA